MPEGQKRPGAGAEARRAPNQIASVCSAHVLTRPRLRSRVLPDMNSLMKLTGAPSEEHLVAQLKAHKVRRAFSRQFVPGSRRPRADQAHPRPQAGDDESSGEEKVQRLLGEGVKERARAFKGARRHETQLDACIRTCKLRTAASRVPAVRSARSAGGQSAGERARRESCAERAPQTDASPAPALRSRPRCQDSLRRRVSRRRVPAVARGGGSGGMPRCVRIRFDSSSAILRFAGAGAGLGACPSTTRCLAATGAASPLPRQLRPRPAPPCGVRHEIAHASHRIFSTSNALQDAPFARSAVPPGRAETGRSVPPRRRRAVAPASPL